MYIDGDRHKLSQVIRNLVSNALKFTSPNGNVSIRAVSLVFPEPTPMARRLSMNINIRRLSLVQDYAVAPIYASRSSGNSPEEAESSRDSLRLKVEVCDDGAGISKVVNALPPSLMAVSSHTRTSACAQENQALLFKGIVQFHAAELQGGKGTGLGLYSKLCF